MQGVNMQDVIKQGLMMDTPLTLTPILERAARLFPKKEIASRRPTHGNASLYLRRFSRSAFTAWPGRWNVWA